MTFIFYCISYVIVFIIFNKKEIYTKTEKKVVLEYFYINVELKQLLAHQAKGHLSIQYYLVPSYVVCHH